MKAEAMSLTFLGNEGLVRIPFFQRGYVWNIENWDDILTDLLDFNKSHFLGSLILKQLEKQTGRPANSRLAKAGGSCFYDPELLNSSFVLLMKFSSKNPRLRKAANR